MTKLKHYKRPKKFKTLRFIVAMISLVGIMIAAFGRAF